MSEKPERWWRYQKERDGWANPKWIVPLALFGLVLLAGNSSALGILLVVGILVWAWGFMRIRW